MCRSAARRIVRRQAAADVPSASAERRGRRLAALAQTARRARVAAKPAQGPGRTPNRFGCRPGGRVPRRPRQPRTPRKTRLDAADARGPWAGRVPPKAVCDRPRGSPHLGIHCERGVASEGGVQRGGPRRGGGRGTLHPDMHDTKGTRFWRGGTAAGRAASLLGPVDLPRLGCSGRAVPSRCRRPET